MNGRNVKKLKTIFEGEKKRLSTDDDDLMPLQFKYTRTHITICYLTPDTVHPLKRTRERKSESGCGKQISEKKKIAKPVKINRYSFIVLRCLLLLCMRKMCMFSMYALAHVVWKSISRINVISSGIFSQSFPSVECLSS